MPPASPSAVPASVRSPKIAAGVHLCHGEGCTVGVPPRMFMCRRHWMAITARLRTMILAEYRPGQEVRKDPTVAYLAAAREAVEFLATKEGRRRPSPALSLFGHGH